MKKRMALLLIGIMSLTIVGGCGDSSTTNNKEETQVVESANNTENSTNEVQEDEQPEVQEDEQVEEQENNTETQQTSGATQIEITDDGAVYTDEDSKVEEVKETDDTSKYNLSWTTDNGSEMKIAFNAMPGIGGFDEQESGVWRLIDDNNWFTIAAWDLGTTDKRIKDSDLSALTYNINIVDCDENTFRVVKNEGKIAIAQCDMVRTDCELVGKIIFIDVEDRRYVLQLLVNAEDKEKYSDMMETIVDTLEISE